MHSAIFPAVSEASRRQILFVGAMKPFLWPVELDRTCVRLGVLAKALGITGRLVYGDGALVHAIEGPAAAIKIFAAQTGATGKNIVIFDEDAVQVQAYDDWRMIYPRPDGRLPGPFYLDPSRGKAEFAAADVPLRHLLERLWHTTHPY